MGMPVAPSYTQSGFRFRNDDGNQTAATWVDDINTNVDLPSGEVFRLRIRVAQTVTNAANSDDLTKAFKVRFSRNGGAYTDVGPSAAVQYGTSSFVSNGNTTTNQLGGTGSFVTGRIDSNGDTGNITFPENTASWTELEFILQLNDSVVDDDDTIDFRVYDTADVALDNYTATAVATATPGETVLSLDATEQGADRMLVMLTDLPTIRLTGIVPDGANAVKVLWSHDGRPPGYVPGDRDERWDF